MGSEMCIRDRKSHGVSRIVIYKATGPGDKVPPQCLSGPVAGLCNVYTPAEMDHPESDFTSGLWPPMLHWNAVDRSVSRSSGTDWLGVYVTCDAGPVLPGFPQVLSSGSVSRLQSQAS